MDATNAKGWYLFDLTQAETNADALLFTGKSSTSNISVVGSLVFTTPANFSAASIDSSGRVDVIKVAGTTQTAGDLGSVTAAIKVKTDYLPSATAGAAGGVVIAGSNAATTFATLTVSGATTLTGNVSLAAGLTVTQSSANTSAVIITGTGSGDGIRVTGGSTGSGIKSTGGATSGHGFYVIGQSATSGNGLYATSVAGSPIYGDLTGNITGSLSGPVGSVTDTASIATAVWAKDISGPQLAGTAADYLQDVAEMYDQFQTMIEADGLNFAFTEDALQNAPGASVTAASIWAYATRTLTSTGSIVIVSPTRTGGNVKVTQGDDYSAADSTALEWTATGWPTFVGGSVSLAIERDGTTAEYAGSVVDADSLRVELTDTQTAGLDVGVYKMQVHVTLAGGGKITPVTGKLTVDERVGT